MLFAFPLSQMQRIRPRNHYSCSPPGVGAVSAPSVLVFLCELFLPAGLPDVSAEDSVLAGFSALVDFFELFVLDGLPVILQLFLASSRRPYDAVKPELHLTLPFRRVETPRELHHALLSMTRLRSG